MLVGPPGTGEESAARLLHYLSVRSNEGFVAVPASSFLQAPNLAPPTSGPGLSDAGWAADQDWGSLFLDGLDTMSSEAQVLLLSHLWSHRSSLGGYGRRTASSRLITASNAELGPLVQSGAFRDDLFYRLNVVTIRLSSLKDRMDDIDDLVDHFLSLAAADGLPCKRLTEGALERLRRHAWPGNVRELETVIRRLIALYPDIMISGDLVDTELFVP